MPERTSSTAAAACDVLYGFGGDDASTIVDSAADRVVEFAGGGAATGCFACVKLHARSRAPRSSCSPRSTICRHGGDQPHRQRAGPDHVRQCRRQRARRRRRRRRHERLRAATTAIYIRNAADRVVEFAGGGNDRVLAGASFTLEAGSEVEMSHHRRQSGDDGDQPHRQRIVANICTAMPARTRSTAAGGGGGGD